LPSGSTGTPSIAARRRPVLGACPVARAYAVGVSEDRARVEDVHELALAMPHVTVTHGTTGNPVYQVGGKSFIFFRNPRPDAVDPHTGQRYAPASRRLHG
jgi:hypothetical protein